MKDNKKENADSPNLFSSIQVRKCTIKNRIIMSPMSQYSADLDGIPNAWHYNHWVSRAIGGAGLIICEATSINDDGCLTENDLRLYNKRQMEAFKHGIQLVHDSGAKFGIQLGHCGRKAWSRTKGKTKHNLVSSSRLAFDGDWKTPVELSVSDIGNLVIQFVESARLAVKAGADIVEIHAAHGYLFHQFLSPISNLRQDEYGGNLENRSHFLLEVVVAVREMLGEDIPLFVRLSCTDWAEPEGFTLKDAVIVSELISNSGADLIDCSSGGTLPITSPPLEEGYQLVFSENIRREANILTAGVGLLTGADFCNKAIETGRCDFVALGRELLRNPYWGLHAAAKLNVPEIIPMQYKRAF